MPYQGYNRSPEYDLYTSMYEKYQAGATTRRKSNIVRKRKVKRSSNSFANFLIFLLSFILLFFVFPVSFSNFVLNVFPVHKKIILNINYHKLMFPTHAYLYKDLFLGKYVIKDTNYKNALMVDIKESFERKGLKNKLTELASKYKRLQPSVYVYDYSTKSFVNINADSIYPAASIIKIPVLIEMFRQIQSGKFSLEDKMILEDWYRASGSGKLQYSQGGIPHSMDYLAKIMIENSDNSSTNMIIAKMGGMPEINRAMRQWGLTITHVNNWLPDLKGTNVTTAKEMAKMLYNIDRTNILDNNSKRHIADYMYHVKNNRLLKAGLPSNAILLHKTGDIGYMLGDAGLVKTVNGKKYIVVILVKRPYNNLTGKEFIVKASKIIYDNISAQ